MRISSNAVKIVLSLVGASLLLCGAAANRERTAPASPPPAFYKNVAPILQQHCQACHRTGEIAPMPLVTYTETRRYARQIKERVTKRIMPPWFADPCCGRFADDPSLTPQQIATLAAWVDAGAPTGNPRDAPPPRRWAAGWIIPRPDDAIRMPMPVAIPAHGDVEYTYEIVPTGFTKNEWVQMSEIRPSSRQNVHHAVVYVRPPGSKWLRHAPIGTPFTASTLTNAQDRRDAEWTDSDILLVCAPGSSPDEWPAGMAKFIPAGSDLVFQMHYVTKGHPETDQASIGLVFAKHPPAQRVLTLQLTNDRFIIPPGVPDFRVEVHGTLPNDCTLLSFFPHMHLRGKKFEYRIIHRDGRIETLLRVHYNFFWQLSYRLAHPRFLKAGTELQAVAWYDNSRDNPHNPDPTVAVRWGDQTYDEMMVGFFDVAVPANVDKQEFFIRHNSAQTKK
ncbi:MAG: thiol-disulfide isomerase [Candidatus Acidiferrales bacterium]